MPQLDVLTYFSQFIYLLISFIAVYVFIHSAVIPKIVSAQKLRQKVNSVSCLAGGFHQSSPYAAHQSSTLTHSVCGLRSSKWHGSCGPRATWARCARAQQLAAAQGFKKRLCNMTLLQV